MLTVLYFYAKKKAVQLTFLQEYVQTKGLFVLDDMEVYIKQKLFDVIGKITHQTKDQLLLAAKISKGKNKNWWQSVADGITEQVLRLLRLYFNHFTDLQPSNANSKTFTLSLELSITISRLLQLEKAAYPILVTL